jgi:Pol polyprotein
VLPPATLASLLGLLTPALLFTLQETAIPLCPSILTLARITLRDASGRIAKVSGWGTVLLQTSDGHVKLSHVRYVPSFSQNLLAYAQLDTLGIVPDGFSIRTPEGYVLIASKHDTSRLTSCRTVPVARHAAAVIEYRYGWWWHHLP